MACKYECGTCGKPFAGAHARDNHCRSTGHARPDFECHTCPQWFQSYKACVQHMKKKNHFFYRCRVCDQTLPTEDDRTAHENHEHCYCANCNQNFSSYNSVKMHLQSRAHRGAQMPCLFCMKCFATAGAVTRHLEENECPRAPFINRDKVYKIIRAKDPYGTISKSLLSGQGSDQYQASGDWFWNGYAYEWHPYPSEFSQLQRHNQHLNSPDHQEDQDLYHCPNRACRMDSKTLAGVINHLESETCGFMRLDDVQMTMGNLLGNGCLPMF